MVSHDDMLVITLAAVAMPRFVVAPSEMETIVAVPLLVDASLAEMEAVVVMPPMVTLAEVKTVVSMIAIPVAVPIAIFVSAPIPISVPVAIVGIVAECWRVPIVLAGYQIVVVVALRIRDWRAGSDRDPRKGGDAQHLKLASHHSPELHRHSLLVSVWILSRVRPALPQWPSPRGQSAGVVARGI